MATVTANTALQLACCAAQMQLKTPTSAGSVFVCASGHAVWAVDLTKLLLFLLRLILQGGLKDVVVSIHSKHL